MTVSGGEYLDRVIASVRASQKSTASAESVAQREADIQLAVRLALDKIPRIVECAGSSVWSPLLEVPYRDAVAADAASRVEVLLEVRDVRRMWLHEPALHVNGVTRVLHVHVDDLLDLVRK